MKPTLEQIGNVPFPPRIPTLAEELEGNSVVVLFTDGTVIDYEFDRGPSSRQEFNSLEDYESFHGELRSPDTELTKRLKRYFTHIDQVYLLTL